MDTLYDSFNQDSSWNASIATAVQHSFTDLKSSQLAFMWLATVLGLPANIAVMVVSIVQFQRSQSEIAQTCLIFNMALAGENLFLKLIKKFIESFKLKF